MIKYLSILRINWIHALEYRANALIGLFAILSGLFIEYQIWSLIFDSNNSDFPSGVQDISRSGSVSKSDYESYSIGDKYCYPE